MLGLQAVIYTIDGWDGVIYFGEEVRNPAATSRAPSSAAFFPSWASICCSTCRPLRPADEPDLPATISSSAPSPNASSAATATPSSVPIMVISLLSCMNANQLFCSRILYAMSTDGLFFRHVTRVNTGGTPTSWPSFSAPSSASFSSSLCSPAPFERVIAMLSFFFVANYTLSYASLFSCAEKNHKCRAPIAPGAIPGPPESPSSAQSYFLVGSIVTDQKHAPCPRHARSELSRVSRSQGRFAQGSLAGQR